MTSDAALREVKQHFKAIGDFCFAQPRCYNCPLREACKSTIRERTLVSAANTFEEEVDKVLGMKKEER